MNKKYCIAVSLFLIFLFSIWMRYIHFDFGLPAKYHYDERIAANTVANFLDNNFVIGRYNHPPFLKTVSYLGLKIYSLLCPIPDGKKIVYSHIALRLASVLFGSLSVIAVYFLAKFFLRAEFSIACSLLLALNPLHVVSSKYGTPDIMLVFMFIVSMICILNLYKLRRRVDYFLCGLTIVLSCSAKYNGIFLYFSFMTAVIFISLDTKSGIKTFFSAERWAFFVIGNICGFVIGFFPLFINYEWKYVLDSLFFERSHLFAEGQHGLTISGMDYYYVFYFIKSILPSTGWFLFCSIIAGLIYVFIRRDKRDVIILASLVPYYLMIEHIYKIPPAPDRYVLPLLPFYLLCAAIFISKTADFFERKYVVRGKPVILILSLVLILYPSFKTFRILKTLTPDTRDMMGEWIEKNIPSSSKIFVNWHNSGYYPELCDNFSVVKTKKLDYDFVAKFDIGYVLLSSFEYQYYIDNPKEAPELAEFYLKIMNNCSLVHETKKNIGPYLYNNPVLRLYRFPDSGSTANKAGHE